jgi:hypothetical protein
MPSDGTPRTVFIVKLRPLPNTDAILELRQALKLLLRRHRLRCVSIAEERDEA